jgi:hypothetical protein
MSGQNKLAVVGNAVLYGTGDVSLAGRAYIYIATNSTLKFYVAGATTSFGGNGVANPPGNATNFYYYGLPSNTSLSLSGNAAFTGAIMPPTPRSHWAEEETTTTISSAPA